MVGRPPRPAASTDSAQREQGLLPFGRRVEAIEPLAADGEEWRDQVTALAARLVRERGYLTPSLLRAAAPEAPHPNHWGAIWARLRAMGLERTREELISATASRNAAREAVWRPGPKWRGVCG